MPLRKRPDLVLESVNRLLRGNSVETLARQLGLDPIVGQLELSFSTFDLKSQKLKPMGHVHNPGLFPVERDAELFENLCRPSQNLFGFGSSSTGHHPVIRPPCELIPLPPHLLVKGSEKDIAQQRRDDPALRGSPWSCILATLLLVARRERLLNELQHPAIGDLLPDKGHELFVVHGPKIVF